MYSNQLQQFIQIPMSPHCVLLSGFPRLMTAVSRAHRVRGGACLRTTSTSPPLVVLVGRSPLSTRSISAFTCASASGSPVRSNDTTMLPEDERQTCTSCEKKVRFSAAIKSNRSLERAMFFSVLSKTRSSCSCEWSCFPHLVFDQLFEADTCYKDFMNAQTWVVRSVECLRFAHSMHRLFSRTQLRSQSHSCVAVELNSHAMEKLVPVLPHNSFLDQCSEKVIV